MKHADVDLNTPELNLAALEKGTIRPGIIGWVGVFLLLTMPAYFAGLVFGQFDIDAAGAQVRRDILNCVLIAAAMTVSALLLTKLVNAFIVRANFHDALAAAVANQQAQIESMREPNSGTGEGQQPRNDEAEDSKVVAVDADNRL